MWAAFIGTLSHILKELIYLEYVLVNWDLSSLKFVSIMEWWRHPCCGDERYRNKKKLSII